MKRGRDVPTHSPNPPSRICGEERIQWRELLLMITYIYIFVGGVPRMGRIGKLIGFAN